MTATRVTADELTLVLVEKDNRLSVWVHDHEHTTYELYTSKCGAVPAPVYVNFDATTKALSRVHEPGQYGILPDGPWSAGMFSMWCKSFAMYGL